MRASGTNGVIIAVSGAWLLGLLTACGGSRSPAAEPERIVRVAQPCPGLELGSDPLDPGEARAFVEVVEVSSRDLPQPIGAWLRENTVKVRSTVSLVAFPNVPTSMPWGQCVDAVCAEAKRSITVTVRLPELASEPLELAVRIDESPPEGSDAAPRVLLDTSVRALNQEPVVIPPVPAISAGTVVVTPYLLRKPHDLHRVMECQVRQADKKAEPTPQ
jgi:hypothetical protein